MSSITTPRCGWIEFKFSAYIYHYLNLCLLGFGDVPGNGYVFILRASRTLAGAPIVMFINIYAGESPIRKPCNFDKPLNHILKVMDGCMQIFCLVSIKTHKIRMLELQPSPFFPFFTDLLHRLLNYF